MCEIFMHQRIATKAILNIYLQKLGDLLNDAHLSTTKMYLINRNGDWKKLQLS